jgi:hypothetical protein
MAKKWLEQAVEEVLTPLTVFDQFGARITGVRSVADQSPTVGVAASLQVEGERFRVVRFSASSSENRLSSRRRFEPFFKLQVTVPRNLALERFVGRIQFSNGLGRT